MPFSPSKPKTKRKKPSSKRRRPCDRWCSSPVYPVGLIYGGQAKTFTEVCADCMRRLKFQPVKTISLDIYRLFEKWLDEQKETER